MTVFFSCSALDTVVERASAIVADLQSLAAFATKTNHRPDKLLSTHAEKVAMDNQRETYISNDLM